VADNEEREFTFTLHGLDVDDGKVRANIFLSEFKTLLDALVLSDKEQNKRQRHEYVILTLEASSALATLRETRAIDRRRLRARRPRLETPAASSVQFFSTAIQAIYNGDKETRHLPKRLVASVRALAKDAGTRFTHGEIAFAADNVIRIDDYLLRQADRTILRISGEEIQERYFAGLAFGTFDGVLKEVDARGTLVRGKLILTAGGKELDCVIRKDDIPQVRETFDLRARVEGLAHYDGDSPLPARLDVKRITPVNNDADLTKWKGAFVRPSTPVDED